jgi:ribosome biogenesis protein ERB1
MVKAVGTKRQGADVATPTPAPAPAPAPSRASSRLAAKVAPSAPSKPALFHPTTDLMPARRLSKKALEEEEEKGEEEDGSDGDVIDEGVHVESESDDDDDDDDEEKEDGDEDEEEEEGEEEDEEDEDDEEDEEEEEEVDEEEEGDDESVSGSNDDSSASGNDGERAASPGADKSTSNRGSSATASRAAAASAAPSRPPKSKKPQKAKGAAAALPKDRGVGAPSDDEELPPIVPGDSSDEDGPEHKSRVGNIPLRWYKDFDHVGYDIDGNKIVRKLKADAIDEFIKKKDDPEFWRTVYDARNDEELRLNDDEVRFLRRLQKNKFEQGYDEYAPYQDWFFPTRDEMPDRRDLYLPKRRFIPSKWENKKIVALVRAIRNGNFKIKEELPERNYDLWLGTAAEVGSKMGPRIEAPKMKLPTHAESYNPPSEYLLSQEEQQQWKASHPDDRKTNFLPQKYSALRLTPAYPPLMRERFERCLDLYLAPRAIKKRMHVDPTDLLPQLPSPEELKPFPCRLGREYIGHKSVVLCVDVHSSGQYIVTGSKDCTAKVRVSSSALRSFCLTRCRFGTS